MPERWATIERLYHEALERGASKRAAFLDEACAGDDALRHEVESLLAHDGEAAFLSTPAVATGTGGATLVGRALGPYVISAQIGEGGMGEVYRAHDTTLGRDVAIKVLSRVFTSDPERLARFEREARVLAALNHPHIGAIYGLEDRGGIRALVLELVEGPTLAERLARGALPIPEALPIARQIAEALEAAHEHGIVHRDLKPANIKVTPGGVVKVLDFGLAKATGTGSAAGLSQSPTVTVGGTRDGIILGTAAYMSPEQARGTTVDKRGDVWAFGAVVFEMLAGRQPFEGETVTELLGAIMHKEPEWTKLPVETPAAVRRVVRRCLTKDPRQRMHDIADARVEIEALGRDPVDEIVSTAPFPQKSWRQYWWIAAAALAAGVLIGVGADRWLQPRRDSSTTDLRAPLMRTTIDLPAAAPLALGSDIPSGGYNSPVVAVSPDGAALAYVAKTASGSMLYLRDMSSGETRPLPGTDGAIHPFFSPDGQWIGFLTVDHVKKIPRKGGTAISLCEANTPVLAWWVQPDLIYFNENETSTLSRVPAGGGKQEKVLTTPDVRFGSFSDVLPDGQTVLGESGSSIGGDFGDIIHVSLRTLETKLLVRSGYAGRYVPPGYVLFARGGNLMAVRFDMARGEVTGEPVTVASGVAMESLFYMLHAASSTTGLAAYVPGADLSVGKLAWVDRRGAVEYLDVPERVYGVIDLAPDGNRLAVHVADVKDYIWIWDIQRREGRRVANPMPEGFPLWSSDGRRLAGGTPGLRSVLLHDVEPSGAVGEGVTIGSMQRFPGSWSPQEDVLAVWLLSAFRTEFLGIGKPVNVAGFDGIFPAFSPDGRWLAYSSTQTGTEEVFIRSYPEGKVVGQVSIGGGIEPRWKPSGELFYRNGHHWFSTHVSIGPEPHWDPPRLVFDTEFIDTPGMSYDVSRDGQRLLVVKRAQSVSQSKINLIVNWFEALPPRQ